MSPLLYQEIAAARREDLLKEAEAFRLAAQASRKSRATLRRRLGTTLVRTGRALLGERDLAHTR